MKRYVMFFASLLATIFLAACGGGDADTGDGSGTVSLYMTDAPFLGENVKEVNITVQAIEYRTRNGWESLTGFTPRTIDLLALRNGKRVKLADFNVTTGHYTQIRFILDAPEKGKPIRGNPGCYLVFDDGTTQPLFVPSGAQSGVKAKGDFVVLDDNGTVEVTADFDIRRSIVKAGNSGIFLLKPVIRITVDELSGAIEGNVTNVTDHNTTGEGLVVFAYEEGDFEAEETAPDENGSRFEHAIARTDVNMSNGRFRIDYLPAGGYDLIFATYTAGSYKSILGIEKNVTVVKGETVHVEVDTNRLAQP